MDKFNRMTVFDLSEILKKEIENGNKDKLLFINEYYIKNGNHYVNEECISFNVIHVQDTLEINLIKNDKIVLNFDKFKNKYYTTNLKTGEKNYNYILNNKK
jgi:hypothetical protein